ncbi:LysR family transcriptional regulator [Azospirillum picis]|uniref:DNA-binding transcriptional LysR family regulator n=1 Tax=Azospirillum picis TaxID=488438 RepID=A0ABU0MT89_9PROT|nr:LysR family transcriptional regulator [Azospirillum picis]MBP2302665.1 DNA-binding transcriptional LysR family regulator [Azospirillum picis]MDQ0536326.1 DNA-binding transcriptional LysR family regulator [Azospirillum picis]
MVFDGRIIGGITVFVAVAKAGSYARAADQVGLSRSGVGKAIARLEERTGMRLFDRTSRALKLTDQGRGFLEEVTPLLERLGAIAMPDTTEGVRGRLRVSTDAAFGPFLLVPALPDLMAAHPQLRIDLLVRDRIDNLLVEGVDVAIRFGEPDARGLDKRAILQSRVVTCATPAYLEAHGVPATPESIVDHHNCIRLFDDLTGKPHSWDFQNGSGDVRSVAPDCGLVVNDAPLLVAAALNHIGIVRLLDFVAEEHLRDGRLVEVLPDWNRRMWPAYLYTPETAYPSPAIQAFEQFVFTRDFGGRSRP